MREGLAGIFGRVGYDVDQAGDFDEALAVLDKGEVNALVVSYRLPPDGCLALLDACEAPPPTVVLNGHADDISGIAVHPSVRTVLTRPFPLQALYDAVAKAASQPERP
jgi:DNA-binding NtrC family response regulator